ncbi:unnamed protein product [Amaranthus hypochondriacus]
MLLRVTTSASQLCCCYVDGCCFGRGYCSMVAVGFSTSRDVDDMTKLRYNGARTNDGELFLCFNPACPLLLHRPPVAVKTADNLPAAGCHVSEGVLSAVHVEVHAKSVKISMLLD